MSMSNRAIERNRAAAEPAARAAAAARTSSREEIASNVRAAMARRQVDQRAIAATIGKSPASVSGRINGTTHFRIDELQRIAALLEVPLEQLLEPAPDQAAQSA